MEVLQDPRINDGESRNCRNDYVSMFHMNGQPILPPLMTSDKRREMRQYKEQALAIERERAKRSFCNRKPSNLFPISEIPISSQTEDSAISPRSIDGNFGQQILFSDESYDSLTDMMRNVELDTLESIQQTEVLLQRENKEKCMKKLKQSETLIYDNILNEIVLPLRNLPDAEYLLNNNCKGFGINTEKIESQYKSENKENIKANKLFLFNPKPVNTKIPEICINPPTPMVEQRNVADLLDNIARQIFESDEENSSYDSCEEMRVGAGCNEMSSEKKVNNEPGENNIRRSATSPAIRIVDVNDDKDDNIEKTVFRSNSFTLESPSKALIDHYMKQQEEQHHQQQQQQQQQKQQQQHHQHQQQQHQQHQQQDQPSEQEKLLNLNKNDSTNSLANIPKRVFSNISASITRDTIESRAKKVKKIEVKQNATAKARLNKAKQPNNPIPKQTKVKRSPYDSISKNELVVQKLTQKSLKKSNTTKKGHSSNSKSKASKINLNLGESVLTTAANEVLGQIEASHREKFIKLIAEQALEQQRMQQAFELQQRTLLEELTKNLSFALNTSNSEINVEQNSPVSGSQTNSGCTTPSLTSSIFSNKCRKNTLVNNSCQHTPPSTIHVTPNTTNNQCNNMNNNSPKGSLCSSTRCSPRRRFVFDNNIISESPDSGGATYRVPNALSSRILMGELQLKKHKAATIINAYARGFLVRRLFQTEQVQRIAQTVRDTLVFVLNLHMDSLNNPDRPETMDSIRLKARLLHQLEAASRTLHLVFFKTTVKERMDIIARDRNRIKTKFLTTSVRRQSESLSNNSFDISIGS